jgi:hypothetical protein
VSDTHRRPVSQAKGHRIDKGEAERRQRTNTRQHLEDQLSRAQAKRDRKAGRGASGATGPEIDWEAPELDDLSPQERRAALQIALIN